jgi:hypothetical protein
VRPAKVDGDLLVAAREQRQGNETVVELKTIQSGAKPVRTDATLYAPAIPDAPDVKDTAKGWQVSFAEKGVVYVDGRRVGNIDGSLVVPKADARQCFQLTRLGDGGLESLPSAATCKGEETRLSGKGPWEWRAPRDGRFSVTLAYANDHGPINTGVTAAVKFLDVQCDGMAAQRLPVVMPHSAGTQRATSATFEAHAGSTCHISLQQGFNMSYLGHNAHYTGGQGGASGPLNEANVEALLIAPQADGKSAP